MGAHDREVTEGRKETIEGGVILRFPGDWVGPLEDLVPFGPSADSESSSPAPDFWGEDSAVLQGAVEAPEQPRVPQRQPLRVRRWLLPAGAALAAALFAVAGVLGGSAPTAPHARAVPFAVASIPPLAPATALKQPSPRHRRAVSRPRSHPKATRPVQASTQPAPVPTSAGTSSSAITTPSPTYHPGPASSASAGNASSQSGGAFTLGGP